MNIDIEKLKSLPPTFAPSGVPDMRLAENKAALKAARFTGHVKQQYVATSGFTGCRKAWKFSNELIAAIEHPALTLFRKLFTEAAASETPVSPSSFVESSIFQAKLKEVGIERPENFVEFAQWWDDLRGPEFAHKLVMAHHRKHGTEPSGYEKRAWSSHLMHRKLVAA